MRMSPSVLRVDAFAGHVAEQIRRIDQLGAFAVDGVEVERYRCGARCEMTAARARILSTM